MPKTIFIVGKPYPETSVARQLHEQGYLLGIFLDRQQKLKHPELFDYIVQLDFSRPQTFEAQLQAADDFHHIKVDGLLCVYENYIVAKAMLGAILNVPAISLEAAERCTDKFLMRQAFMETDPSITPAFSLVESQDQLLSFADSHTYPLIMKPANLIKSLLVMQCNNREELLENYAVALESIQGLYDKYGVYERSPRLIVEEYIEGKQCSVAAYVDTAGTAHFCGGITVLTTANEIGVHDSYLFGRQLPAELPTDVESRILATARTAIGALGMRSSPAHVELIWNGSSVKVVEIGARTGGYRNKMYRLAYGTDLLNAEVTTALGLAPSVPETPRGFCGVYELFPQKTGRYAEISGLPSSNDAITITTRVQPGQTIGPAKLGYKSAAVVTVVAADAEQFKLQCDTVLQMKVVTT